jgi:hypothetical protein
VQVESAGVNDVDAYQEYKWLVQSPFEVNPPTARRLAWATGLPAIHKPTRALTVTDAVGGNEDYREAALADTGGPIPLPNPAVVQIKPAAAQARTLTVRLEPDQKMEIKAIMNQAQAILYAWSADGGPTPTFTDTSPMRGKSLGALRGTAIRPRRLRIARHTLHRGEQLVLAEHFRQAGDDHFEDQRLLLGHQGLRDHSPVVRPSPLWPR